MKWSIKQRLDSAYLSTPLGLGFTVCRTGEIWRCYARDITGLTDVGTESRNEYPEIEDVLPTFTYKASTWLMEYATEIINLSTKAFNYAQEIDHENH